MAAPAFVLFAAATFTRISPTMAATLGAALLLLVVPLLIGKIPLRYNVRNLAVRWRTTLMTALAFTLVVGLLVVMLAFVNGMARLTEQSGQPGNVIVLSDGATDETFSNLGYSDVTDLARQPGVVVEGGRPLASLESYMIVTQPLPAIPGKPIRRRFVQVRGLDDAELAGKVHGLSLLEGKWMPEDDPGVQDPPDGKGLPYIRAILGQGLAAQFAADRKLKPLKVGDTFELGERAWIVHGVLASSGSSFDSELWAKRKNVGERFGKNVYTTVVLRTADAVAAGKLAEDLKTNFTKAKVAAQTETDYFSKLSETNKQFTYAIGFIAVFMAIGGVFGVMNTMFAAVSQRSKDIGVLRIVGYAKWQVLISFFVESIVIALIGGLLGCAAAMLVDGVSATSLVSSGQASKSVVLKLTVDANILSFGLIFTLFMGAIGGLIPALSAMWVSPLESLR